MSPKESLTEALFSIYANTGREVTYITEKGEERPYWANRFRQALQRAVDEDNVVGFVERLVGQPEPSRGFGYLAAADRLDLTVEALVVRDEFRGLFSPEIVSIAEERLDDPDIVLPQVIPAPRPKAETEVEPGSSFTVKVTVDAGGALSLQLV